MRPVSRFACLFSTGILALHAAAQRDPDVQISANAEKDTFVRLASSGTTVHAAWRRLRFLDDINLFTSSSFDGGVTWLPETRLNEIPGDATNHRIAASGDAVYAVWESVDATYQLGSRIYFDRSVNQGLTWLNTDIRLDVGGPLGKRSFNPVLAVVDDHVHVVWSQTLERRIAAYYTGSPDRGITWSPPVRLDTGSPRSSPARPQIAAAGAAVYVVWEDRRDGQPDIYLNRSLDHGATWLPVEVRLDLGDEKGATESESPRIAASGSTVMAVWVDRRHGRTEVLANGSGDQGTTWLTTAARVNTSEPPGTSFGEDARVAVEGSTAHVVWQKGLLSSTIQYNSSSDAGTTWLAPDVSASGAPRIVHTPRLAAHSGGAFVAWVLAEGSRQIQCNRTLDAGATWLGAPVRVSLGTPPGMWQTTRHPDITASESTVFIGWNDDRAVEWNIHGNVPLGFVPYGQGKAGSAGLVPTIAGSGWAAIGQTVTLDVTDGVGGAGGALLLGAARASVPLFGATLLVTPDLPLPVALGGTPGTPGAGTLSLPVPLPRDSALLGLDLYFQAVLVDASASGGVTLTNALEMWIG